MWSEGFGGFDSYFTDNMLHQNQSRTFLKVIYYIHQLKLNLDFDNQKNLTPGIQNTHTLLNV